MLESEILKKALEDGIIDLDTIYKQIEMNKRAKYLSEHEYKIWQGTDGKWRTYLPGSPKRRLIKKSTKEKVEDAIVEYYENQEKPKYTFQCAWNDWVERQKNCGRSENTISKYISDYKRFFSGYEIETMEFISITEESIGIWLKKVTSDKEIPYKALKSAFSTVDNIFKYSIRKRIVRENPCDFVDLELFKKDCKEKEQILEERTLSDYEMSLLINKLRKSYETKPNYIPQYAIEFAMYSGLRVGELSALMWDDINYKKKIITIRRSEKQNKMTKEYYIAKTKTCKIRVIPLTEEMQELLNRIKFIETKFGYLGDYIFMNENGIIHKNVISDCIRNRTMYGNFCNAKSINAIRRTINSDLRCRGMSSTVASSLIGNSEKVNDSNYTYDTSDMEYKRGLLKEVNKKVSAM